MNEKQMETLLDMALTEIGDTDTGIRMAEECDGAYVQDTRTLRDAMVTRNAGLVITMDDGSEFQVTIVQSAQADPKFTEGVR